MTIHTLTLKWLVLLVILAGTGCSREEATYRRLTIGGQWPQKEQADPDLRSRLDDYVLSGRLLEEAFSHSPATEKIRPYLNGKSFEERDGGMYSIPGEFAIHPSDESNYDVFIEVLGTLILDVVMESPSDQ